MNINLLTEYKGVVNKYFSDHFDVIVDLIFTHLQMYIRWNTISAQKHKSS